MALRVIFMGTPDFAVPCLDILIKNKYDVVAVVTQPDRRRGRGQKVSFSPVKELALAHNLLVMQPERIKSPEFIEQITVLKPDLIVVVAFGQFLPKSLLELPPLGCINVHASLLPGYRGAAPIHWAIMNGEKVTGVTTMYMDIGMDTGDMILKSEVNILPEETTGELHDKLQILGAELLLETVKQLETGTALRISQNQEEATYASLLTREHERIDWTQSAQTIHDMVRGLNPWPGAYCRYQDKIMKIWKTQIADPDFRTSCPGRVVKHTDCGIVVETGRGTLLVTEIQPESKRRMGALECACGHCLAIGDILG